MYQIALSVVGVLVTLTASGIPITVSRLILKARAKNETKTERQVISAGIFTSIIISLPITLVLYFFRNKLSFIFADSRCYDILIVILPSIVFTSVYAVIRGVFWGNKSFLIYSLIELIEEIVMLVFGIILVSKMTSVYDGSIKAGQAVFISYLVSFAISTTVFIIQGGRITNPIKQLGPLLEASLPITLMRTATSLIGSLIAIILPSRLITFGLTSQEALARYGELSGMAFPLLFIPSTVIGSIALVLVPDLAENFYCNRHEILQKKISNSIKCSVLITCFIFPVFIACGKELGNLVYSNENAGIFLSVSAIMMLPMSITLITTSILNSINMEKKTLAIYLVGALFLLVSVYFAPKYIGIYALIAGHMLSYLITSTLNLLVLEKTFKKKLHYKKHVSLSIGCAIGATLFGYFFRNLTVIHLSNFLTIAIVSIAVMLYNFIVMKLFNVFDVFTILKKDQDF